MSKSLGIKINIDYSEVNELKAALKEKIPIKLDDSGISNTIKSIDGKLQNLKSNNKINLTMDVNNAKSKLNEFKTAYTNLKNEVESGMKFKLDLSDAFADNGAVNIKKNLEKMGFSSTEVQKQMDRMVENLNDDTHSAYSKLKTASVTGKDGTKNIHQTATEQLDDYTTAQVTSINNETKRVQVEQNRLKMLKDIASTTSELKGLEAKQVNADPFSMDAISKRIEDVSAHLNQLKSSWKEMTGTDAGDNNIVKMAESLGEYNIEMKAAALAKQEQNKIDKETAEVLKQVISLENEKSKLQQNADTKNVDEAKVMTDRASAIDKEISKLKEKSNLEQRLSSDQKEQLEHIQKSNAAQTEYVQNVNKAKQSDKTRIDSQKENYKQLEQSIKDAYQIQEKMADLEAKQDNNTITGKEETRLNTLRKELELKEQISEADIKMAQESGKITQDQSESLQSLERSRQARLDNVQSLAQERAELAKIDSLYDQVEQSVKKVQSLNEQKSNAGREETAVIDSIIAKEQELQSEMLETIAISGKKNDARQQELNALKESVSAQERERQVRERAKAQTDYRQQARGNMDTLTDIVSVRAIANEGKQAFQYLYRNIKELDDAMVDVRKVATGSDKELADFERNIFDHASGVGKSASEFAVSVERWSAAGYDLNEAIEFAELSTKGAFVGNIDESAMVNYMSVPMIAYEKQGLRAQDILNSMNEVANRNAVEMDTLGQAYARAASTASNAGTSFSELTGLIGAAEETTRLGGETIGTSLRTMDINIAKIASKNTTGLEKKFDTFKEFGIDLLDTNGNLKSTYDVLEELQGAWDGLSTVEKTTMGMDIAGARGQAVITALMNNWGRVQKMIGESDGQLGMADGYGSMFDEFETAQDSMAFKQAALNNAWQEFIHIVTGGKGPFIELMSLATQAIDKMSELAEDPGVVKNITNIAKGLGSLVAGIVGAKGLNIVNDFFRQLGSSLVATGTTLETARKAADFSSLGKGLLSITRFIGPLGKIAIAIGAIYTAAKLLERVDIDLFGQIGAGFNQGLYQVRQMSKEKEQLSEDINTNLFITGDLTQAHKDLVSYEQLVAAKELQLQVNPNVDELEFSPEEFAQIQSSINGMIETFDLEKDLQITWNDFGDIKAKIREVQDAINELTGQTVKDAMQDVSDYIEDGSYGRGVTKSRREAGKADRGQLEQMYASERSNELHALVNDRLNYNDQEYEAAMQAINDSYERNIASIPTFNGAFISPEMEEAENKRVEAFERILDSRKQIAKSMADGLGVSETLDSALSDVDPEQGASVIRFMAAEVGKYRKEIQDIDSISDKLKGDDPLTQKDVDYVKELNSELSTFNNDSTTWSTDQVTKATKALETHRKEVAKNAEELQNSLNKYGGQYGVEADTIERIAEARTKGGLQYMNAMLDQGEWGRLELGITARLEEYAGFTEGQDIKSIVRGMQDQVDTMDKDVVVRYNLKDEYDVANFEVLDDILELADVSPEIVTTYSLIQEDGSLNVEAIPEMLDNLPTEVITSYGFKVNQDGSVNLEGFVDTLNGLSEEDRELVVDLIVNNHGTEEIHTMAEAMNRLPKEVVSSLELTVDGKFDADRAMNLFEYFKQNPSISSKFGLDVDGGHEDLLTSIAEVWGTLDDNGRKELTVALNGATEAYQETENLKNAMITMPKEVITAIELDDGNLDMTKFDTLMGMVDKDHAIEMGVHVSGDVPTFQEIANAAYEYDGTHLEFLIELFGEENIESLKEYGLILDEVPESATSEISIQTNVESESAEEFNSSWAWLQDNSEIDMSVFTSVENGADFELLNQQLENIPEEVRTSIDVDNNASISLVEFVNYLQTIDDVDYRAQLVAQVFGQDAVAGLEDDISAVEGEHGVVVKTTVLDDGLTELTFEDGHIAYTTSVEEPEIPVVEGDTVTYDAEVTGTEELATLNETVTSIPESKTVSITLDTTDVATKATEVQTKMTEIDALTGKPKIDADKSGFDTAISAVDNSLAIPRSTTVQIRGDSTHYDGVIANLRTRSVMVNIRASVSSSKAIGQQLGSSFSASVGDGIFGTGRSRNTTVGRSSATSTEAKVNEEVWRYWAKELFEGLPLENSLDELSNQIKKSSKNQDQLIRLYKQQLELLRKQMAHEKEMQKAQTSELKGILTQLGNHGFKSDGNRITNLDHAKSFSGDTATDVDKLLSEWRKLYESINSIDKNLSQIDLEMFNTEEDIRQAEIKKELERLEKRMKQAEAILLAVENNTSIQETKEDMVGSEDFELELAVKEQGLNTATRSVRELLDTYNSLAAITVQYSENAEDMYNTLESLRDGILESADAIIEYREELNRIRVDRLIGDFDKFNSVMERNANILSSNIEHMQEGLLSGQSLSDLEGFGILDINRKTKLERDHEFRLNLEAQLNKALDDYAKKNIDRTKSVATNMLKVEASKYNQLLRMSSDYSKGIAVSPTGFNDIGIDSLYDAATSADSKMYDRWKSQLQTLTHAYSGEYTALVYNYERAIDSASNSIEKQALSQKMVLDQLKLQEKLYKDMIVWNNKFIEQSELELKNTSLTTEQRNELLDAIEEYREANLDAQQSIRDTVSARYEYEFTLLDKAMNKAERYVSSLQSLLDVAELVNVDANSVAGLYEAIYASKVNQYKEAKNQLQDLMSSQKEFEEGSYEWNLLNDKILEVSDSLKELGVNALNANHDVLNNALETVQEKFEKGLLNEMTLEDWKTYNEQWISGLEKQLTLEDLRLKALNVEDGLLKDRLEMLDRQEKVSQKDIEYMDKQLKALELQGKLENIGQERNVQTLVRDEDGRFGLAYDYDQSEYEKTQKELNEAQQELVKFRREQQQGYAEALGLIVDRAGEGRYGNTSELKSALDNLQDVYGTVLNDIPDLGSLNYDDLLEAYERYLNVNNLLANDIINPSNSFNTDKTIQAIGTQFETSFMKISNDFGKVIGNEVRQALQSLMGGANDDGIGGNTFHINELVFPNVESSSEIQSAIIGLKDKAIQKVNRK